MERDNYKLYAEFQRKEGHDSTFRLFRGQLYKVVKRNFKGAGSVYIFLCF